MILRCTVNGADQVVEPAWAGESLLYVLRERMGLPGSKNACEQGECGSCTVLLDGLAGLLLPGRRGPGAGPRRWSRSRGWRTTATIPGVVGRAFLAAGAVQCGFCTPGFVVAVHDLLAGMTTRQTPRSARLSPATCAAARATRRSWTPCALAASETRAGHP